MNELLFPDVDFGRDPVANLYEMLAEMRERARAVTVRWDGGYSTVLTHGDDVAAGLRDDDVFPASVAHLRSIGDIQGRTMMCMTGEEHRRHRNLVKGAFDRTTSRDLTRTLIEPIAHALVDRFAADGEADLVESFTRHFSFEIIARILGLPASRNEDLHRWVAALFPVGVPADVAKRAADEFTRFMLPAIEARRREPQEDLLSDLAAAEIEGRRLPDEEILSFIRLLFPAGADTTYLAVGSMMVGVLATPGIREALTHDPAARPMAVEEALRWESPTPLLGRWVEAPTEWRGLSIPPGHLHWSPGAANRDPNHNDEPDAFRPDRGTRSSLTFGQGRHFCLGSHLARAEMKTALGVLLDRLPNLRLRDEEPPPMTGSLLRGPRTIPVRFDPQ